VLYDADGDFERNFDWWTKDSSKHRFVEPQLPFGNGRTDLLMTKIRNSEMCEFHHRV